MRTLLNPANRTDSTKADRRTRQGCGAKSIAQRRQHFQSARQSSRLFWHTADCNLPPGLFIAVFAGKSQSLERSLFRKIHDAVAYLIDREIKQLNNSLSITKGQQSKLLALCVFYLRLSKKHKITTAILFESFMIKIL